MKKIKMSKGMAFKYHCSIMLALIGFSSSHLFAQQAAFSTSIEIKKLKEIQGIATDDYFIVLGEPLDGVTTFFVVDRTTGTYSSLDTQGRNYSLLGHAITSDSLFVYFLTSPNASKIKYISYGKQSTRLTEIRTVDKLKHRNSLATFNWNDALGFLSLSGNDSEVMLTAYSGDRLVVEKSYTLSEPMFDLLSRNAYTFVPSLVDYHFGMVRNPYKIFQHHDQLVILAPTEEEEYAAIRIAFLENDSPSKERLVKLPFSKKMPFNSFFFKSKTFVVGIDGDFIGLSIFDEKLNIQKDLRYVKGTSLDFKRSDLVKDGESLDKEWSGRWSEEAIAKNTLKILNMGIPVISVSQPSLDSYRILIGANKVTNQVSPVAYGTGAGGAPTGFVYARPESTYQWDGYESDYSSRSHFYGYLHTNNLEPYAEAEHVRGALFSIAQRVVDLQKETKLGGSGIINSADAAYLIYLDRKKGKLAIEEFK